MRNPRTPAEWFRVGVLALAAARQASRALARSAPRSSWNQRLTAEAMRWAQDQRPGPLVSLRLSWRRLRAAWRRPATPANLYQRAHAAELLGGSALARAATNPALAARIDGLRALAASQADQIALAAREYRAGLALAPRNAALHSGLGQLERSQRRYPAAAQELAVAWRLDPNDAVTAFEYGDVEFRLNHPRRALRLLDRAVALAPGMLVARWTRAQVERALRQYPAALRDYLAARPVDRTGKLEYQLGRLYQRMGRRKLAAAAFRRSAAQRASSRR
jgi:tetratricopeptide (TPR) repeat protein